MGNIISAIQHGNDLGVYYNFRSAFMLYTTSGTCSRETTLVTNAIVGLYQLNLKSVDDDTVNIHLTLNKGQVLVVKFTGVPPSDCDLVAVKINGGQHKYLYCNRDSGSATNPKDVITNGSVYFLVYDGTAYWLVDAYRKNISAKNVISSSSVGTTNAISDTANNSTYINLVDNSTVISSMQVIGSGATTVSGKDGVLTITSTGGTSVDEKLTVSTYTGTAEKYVVLHDGGGSNGIGYGSTCLKFRTSTSGDDVYDDLTIGSGIVGPTIYNSKYHAGRLKLGAGKSTIGGGEIFGILTSAPGNSTTTNTLPRLDGELVSSGGFMSNYTVPTENGIQATTYYQCLYKGGNVYAPAMGTSSGGGGATKQDIYINGASWSMGTSSGPELIASYSYTLGTQSLGAIPVASTSQSGVVTTINQTFSGRKEFSDGITIASGETISFGPIQASTPPMSGQLATYVTSGAMYRLIGRTLNGGLLSGPLIGTDTTKFLCNDGTWQVPAGGGGTHYIGTNIWGANALITTLPTQPTNNSSTYLNHIENNSVTSSLLITGTGNVTVSAYGNVLTINGSGGGGGGYTGTNVFSNSSIGTTNATVNIGSTVYLNHVENGSVTSSLQFIQGGYTSIYASNGQMTITSDQGGGGGGAGGTVGALVISTTSTGKVNASSTTNNNTYLNHVEDGVVNSSLKITGSGGASVAVSHNTLTITSADGYPGSGIGLCIGSNGLVNTITPEIIVSEERLGYMLLPEQDVFLPVVALNKQGHGLVFSDDGLNGHIYAMNEFNESTEYINSPTLETLYPDNIHQTVLNGRTQEGALAVSLPKILNLFMDSVYQYLKTLEYRITEQDLCDLIIQMFRIAEASLRA